MRNINTPGERTREIYSEVSSAEIEAEEKMKQGKRKIALRLYKKSIENLLEIGQSECAAWAILRCFGKRVARPYFDDAIWRYNFRGWNEEARELWRKYKMARVKPLFEGETYSGV